MEERVAHTVQIRGADNGTEGATGLQNVTIGRSDARLVTLCIA